MFQKSVEISSLPNLTYDIPIRNIIFCQLFEVDTMGENQRKKAQLSMNGDLEDLDEDMKEILLQKNKRI